MGLNQTNKSEGVCDACGSDTQLQFKAVNPITSTEGTFCSRGCAQTLARSPSDITRVSEPTL